jgi:membrane protease YdiL (CAAX protease family)
MTKPRLLIEMLLFYAVFFLPGYLSQAGMAASGSLSSNAMLQIILTGLPQCLLMIYVAGFTGSREPSRYGLLAFEPRDALRLILLLAGSAAIVLALSAVALLLPPQLGRGVASGFRWGLASPAQLPLALLFALTAGYREEFFFRAYLLTDLGELGVPLPLAAAASTALFSMGHLYEGPMGIAVSAALGALFCAAWIRRPSLHVIALAHGLFNTAVLALGLIQARALPAAGGIGIFTP